MMRRKPILSRALLLEEPERSPDGAGGFAIVWRVLGALWAEVTAATGREAAAAGAALAIMPTRVLVRAASFGARGRPVPGQRFREGPRVFEILTVQEADRLGKYLLCMTQEARLK